MTIREYSSADYLDVSSWWTKQGWTAVPSNFLGIKGFISENENEKIAACWIYIDDNCPMCLVEWYVGNPDVNWELRRDGINSTMNACFEYAKSKGKSHVFTMTKNKRLIEKFIDNGFIKSDEDVTHLIRSL